VSRDADHLAAVRALGLTSYMSVPLIAHGRTLGALSFATAESGRRYTDEDLRFAADVAYRAALAVDNARAYEQANAASRAKDEFLATLSHELRTPLNAVLGWMRMLRAGGVRPERVAHALEVVERNASAQLRLVEDLLDLSRIITGKFRLEVQPVDLPAVIDAAVESVQPAATAKDIRVHVLIAPEAAPVQGDPARLQQAVWNLLSNAIKFTPRGGRVQLAVRPGDSHVEIDVADTGAGIRRDVLPFVFDRFRQGDSGPSRGYAGLGLGLAIVRHIVELHGGTVSADSEGEGRGATFRITLPLTVPRTGVPPEVAAEAAAPREDLHVAVRLDGCRVLVVEDDGDARELVAELLAARGAEVTAVGSAAEALATIDDAAFDVIVSDLEMPGQDGFAFIRALRLRAPDRGGAIPAVALTAYARPQDRARSLVAGFQMHLAKPVDADELIATVASVGGRART
jgi:signal transduction histidine kinase/ActR/RegA family two-component response regulator